MDPLRSDMRPAEALNGPERDARIEQLLLAGLDEYFAHRYEHAINLWTRVLFFDRQHDRARAYIERARRAQAERQRESEAALHQAIEALRAGDIDKARSLVGDALDRGASPDEAHGMLERIERLGVAQTSPKLRRRLALPSSTWSTAATGPVDPERARWVRGYSAAVLLAIAAVGVLGVAISGLTVPAPTSWSIGPTPNSATSAIPWTPEPLPVPNASELYVARARGLLARGRVHDALAMLDRIPDGDPLRGDAERLRAEAQQRLLSTIEPEPPPE
jgi:hypothetical protein